MSEWKNTLYYGDNLSILREYIANESVDFIYLDPPFNSNRNYSEWAIGGDAKRKYPKIQVLTIAELLAGASVQMPPTARTYKKSQKETVQDGVQEHIALQENTSEWTPSF